MVSIANEQPFCVCIGSKLPIFPAKLEIQVSREKVKTVAQLMKIAVERSTSVPELNEQVTQLAELVGRA